MNTIYQVYQVHINNNKIVDRKTLKGAQALAEREAAKDNFKAVAVVRFEADQYGSKETTLGSISLRTRNETPFVQIERNGIFA